MAARRRRGAAAMSGSIEVADRTPGARWRRLPLGVRVAIIVVGVLVGINLLAKFVSDSTGGGGTPGGPRSSAYATQNEGLAAYAELLAHEGHPVDVTRGPLRDGTLDPATTVVVLDPDTVSFDDAGILLTFVVNGGRLITGGTSPSYFTALRRDPPLWAAPGPTDWSQIDPSLAPISRVVSAGDARFSTLGDSRPLVGDASDALVTEASVGRGTIVFVADASALQNQLLGTADNAALGLALAGGAGRTVVFPEGVHGYGPSSGLGAIPNQWKVALVGIAIAGLVLMWARGRRLGPPEDASRPLPPPRATYVDALGSTLVRTRRPDAALHAVATHVRERIDARAVPGADGAAGATGDLDRAEFARRGRAIGLSDVEIDAVLSPITDESVLAVGRALSRVEQSTGKEDR
jgi:hypothetical protein